MDNKNQDAEDLLGKFFEENENSWTWILSIAFWLGFDNYVTEEINKIMETGE